jgi:DNA-binding NtrC family response regulator
VNRRGGINQTSILAIDDEEGFLSFLRMALESEGYTVHVASDPCEALKFYAERGREVGMVLLDFVLPKMSADTVFDELQLLNPDVRVVLLTACDDFVAERMFKRGLRGYLQKPFDLQDLAQRVRHAIDSPVGSVTLPPARDLSADMIE